MASPQPELARQFAIDAVSRLRGAGFLALFAGGCVRDELMGRMPKDFDVATDATPPQIRELFGRRRTLAIGQAFGVITVIGNEHTGQIDVATFRSDAGYSDGRHPDAVRFCTPREDALRRDFTINGMFYDPLKEEVIDYVGGQQDLQRRVIRAIGDPHARIAEDKLRMLRAVRCASIFDFAVDQTTMSAIQQHATQLQVVSVERITSELRRMLADHHRRRAVQLLDASGLLDVILPELVVACPRNSNCWQTTLDILERLPGSSFPFAFATLIREVAGASSNVGNAVVEFGHRLRLTNRERDVIRFVLANEALIRSARQADWPRLQRILIEPHAVQLIDYCQVVAQVCGDEGDDVSFCRQRLAWPVARLNPPPLIFGGDLRKLGIAAGPAYGRILDRVRDAQLSAVVTSKPEALEMAARIAREMTNNS